MPGLISLSDLSTLPALAPLGATVSGFLFIITKVVKLGAAKSHSGHFGTCWQSQVVDKITHHLLPSPLSSSPFLFPKFTYKNKTISGKGGGL